MNMEGYLVNLVLFMIGKCNVSKSVSTVQTGLITKQVNAWYVNLLGLSVLSKIRLLVHHYVGHSLLLTSHLGASQ